MPRGQLRGEFALFGSICLLCGMGLFVAGAVHARARTRIVRDWLRVSGVVRSCAVQRDHPFADDGGGVVEYIQCDVDYSLGGGRYTTRLHSTQRRTGNAGFEWPAAADAATAEPLLEAWVAAHRSGAAVPMRVDPAHPTQASWIGEEPALDVDLTGSYGRGGVVFVGVALLLGGLAGVGQKNKPRVQ